MAKSTGNFDFNMMFVKPRVIETVLNLLQNYKQYKEHLGPCEFLKAFFEVRRRSNKQWASRALSQVSQPSLWNDMAVKTTEGALQATQTQNQSNKSINRKCKYLKICQFNVDHLAEKPNVNYPESSDFHQLEHFPCTCTSEDESSSSGFDSDGSKSNSSDQTETLITKDESSEENSTLVDNEAKKGNYAYSYSIVDTGSVLKNSIQQRVQKSDENCFRQLYADNEQLDPTENQREGIKYDIDNFMASYNNEMSNRNSITQNISDGLKITQYPGFSGKVERLSLSIEGGNPEKVHELEIDVEQLRKEWQCQKELRATKCALRPDSTEDQKQLLPPQQVKPKEPYIRSNNILGQAAMKMFLHIIDCNEFITTCIRAFARHSQNKVDTPFFKVATYLIFFNLTPMSLEETKHIFIDYNLKTCLQYLDFITSDDFQKYSNELLRYYDQDFVKNYAEDHVKGPVVKRLQEEMQTLLVVKKAPEPKSLIQFTPHQFEENLEKDKEESTMGETENSAIRELNAYRVEEENHIIHAHPIPESTYIQPSNKFYKNPKVLMEEKLKRKKKKKKQVATFRRSLLAKQTHEKGDGKMRKLDLPPICKDGPTADTCEGCFARERLLAAHSKIPQSERKSGIPLLLKSVQRTSCWKKQVEVDLKDASCCIPQPSQPPESKPVVRKSKFPPDFTKVVIPVKATAASVLREGAYLRNNEQKTLRNLEWVASGGADVAALEELLARRREERQREELEALERKHLQGLLSHEEAILAKQQLVFLHRANAHQVKMEKEELEKQIEILRKEEEEKIKMLVDKTHSIEMAAREKPKEVQKHKSDIVQKMLKEAKEQMAEIQRKRQEELLERITLIREVRAMQGLAKMKHKEIDLTETSGLGLLGEMSIAELHERLNLLREELREEVEKKREKAQNIRAKTKQRVVETQEYINKHRQNKLPEEKTKSIPLKNVKNIQSEELNNLRDKLNATRQLRLNSTKLL